MKTTKPEVIAVSLYSVGKSIAEAMIENIPAGEWPGVAWDLLDRLAHIQNVLHRNEHDLIFRGAVSAFGYRVELDSPSGLADAETDEDIEL